MEFVDFLLRHPGINFYIDTLLKPNYFADGISGFKHYNLLVVGGDKEERDTFGSCIPGILQKFLKKQLEQNVKVVKRHITCTDKTVTQIKSEIFHHLEKQDLLIHITDRHVIEILSLYDIHKEMFPLLEELIGEIAGQSFLPHKYTIGLVVSTLKTGENISYLPKNFMEWCETYDLSKRELVTSEENQNEVERDNDKLIVIKNELLNLAKNGIPTLLYGKDTYGREELIKKIHKLNGGIDRCWEYIGIEKNIENMDELQDKVLSAYKSDNYKKAEKLIKDYNNTAKTYRYIDFCLEGGKKVSESLGMFNFICSYLGYGGGILVESDSYGYYDFSENSILVGERAIYNHDVETEECLHIIDRKGLLFIDNIQCEYKDYGWYKKIATKIERRRHRDCKSSSGNWFVAYAYDYTTFPQQFLDQFVLVSLDGSGIQQGVKQGQEEVRSLKYEWTINIEGKVMCNGQYIAELPNLQFKLFECLYKKRGKYVKNETLKKCWENKKPDYKDYLSTEMSKIRSKLKTGLEKNNIPVNGEVIEPKKENKKNVSYKLVTSSSTTYQ
jgi:hypothetical protein